MIVLLFLQDAVVPSAQHFRLYAFDFDDHNMSDEDTFKVCLLCPAGISFASFSSQLGDCFVGLRENTNGVCFFCVTGMPENVPGSGSS